MTTWLTGLCKIEMLFPEFRDPIIVEVESRTPNMCTLKMGESSLGNTEACTTICGLIYAFRRLQQEVPFSVVLQYCCHIDCRLKVGIDGV